MSQLPQLRKGSTPLLVLSVLSHGQMYGYQIMRELEKRSAGYFAMTAALLYPALHQMETDGLLEGEWKPGQGKRRRKFYRITPKGRKALVSSQAEWELFVTNLFRTLDPARNTQEDPA